MVLHKQSSLFAILFTILLAAALSASGQTVAPDEVRVSSRAWSPATVFRAAASEVQVEVVVRDLKAAPSMA